METTKAMTIEEVLKLNISDKEKAELLRDMVVVKTTTIPDNAHDLFLYRLDKAQAKGETKGFFLFLHRNLIEPESVKKWVDILDKREEKQRRTLIFLATERGPSVSEWKKALG